MNNLRILAATLVLALAPRACADEPARPATSFRAMTWNIWHGGREDGEDAGPGRVVDVIRESKADIVAMQETYGSGEHISKALQFEFHPRGTNVSILSRYPIVEDISVFEEFKCVGALVELPGRERIAFYSLWLPYDEDIWLPGSRDDYNDQQLSSKCDVSAADLRVILKQIDQRLSDAKYDDVPLFIAGDFNSMSHLDYTDVNRDQFGHTVKWPTSRVMKEAGFRDSFREVNPGVSRAAHSTWSPRFVEQEQDRIDFVYYRSNRWRATTSKVIDEHATWFPSDHAAVITQFERSPTASLRPQRLRTIAYNIRHAVGMDGKLSVMRTAKHLRDLQPDIVGLAEVDMNCKRSGSVNQAAVLGKALAMHAAFGKFMDYDGGQYGMGILSKYPIVEVHNLELPPGGEPRIALMAEVLLPSDEKILVVNVHFDWVSDDAVRFQQAKQLYNYLQQAKIPIVLLGDFNDQPASRTLKLFDEYLEADKPQDDRFTWSAAEPQIEIDFIFAAPRERWSARATRVVDEPVVSDHRPVFTELTLRP